MRGWWALYPLRWSQRQYWDWVDYLAIAVILSWGAAGVVGGVAIDRAIVPPVSMWFSIVIGVAIAALSALLGLWVMAFVAYAVDREYAQEQRDAGLVAFPVATWERRLGVALISYFMLSAPVAVAVIIAAGAFTPFWRSAGGVSLDVGNLLFYAGTLVLLAQGLRRYAVVLHSWRLRVVYSVVALWLLIGFYSTLPPLTHGIVPPFSAFVPAYGVVAQIWPVALLGTFFSAASKYRPENDNGTRPTTGDQGEQPTPDATG